MEDLGPFTIANSHSHDFTAKSNGQAYRAWVATPAKRIPGQVRPVLYTLDANGSFGMVAETARFLAFGGEIPPVIVVGVGYPGNSGLRDMMTLRNYELTPSVDQAYVARAEKQEQPLGPNGLGGAPGFHDFLTGELAPFIEEHYGADPADRALCGYSLGGLFAAWSLLQESPAFHRYIVGSPSLWWDDRMLFGVEAARADGPKSLAAHVYVSAGELEEDPSNKDLTPFRMVSNAIEFAGLLGGRGYEGLSLELELIRNAGHQQPPMLVQGLRSVYRGHPALRPPA